MQDLLLELQATDQRTVVFISHDLDEAMRIGDRIAIMEGGRVVQVGTPEEILQNPADDYVRAFFRGVDPTSILTVGEIALDSQPTIVVKEGKNLRAALQRLIQQDRDYGYVLDMEHRFQGVVSTDSLRDAIDRNDPTSTISKAFLPDAVPANGNNSMQAVLAEVTAHPWPVPIVSDNGRYLGVLSKTQFLRTLQRGQEEPNGNGAQSGEEVSA
jgi:glycine betaine/proline transport system ATP-binding protein